MSADLNVNRSFLSTDSVLSGQWRSMPQSRQQSLVAVLGAFEKIPSVYLSNTLQPVSPSRVQPEPDVLGNSGKTPAEETGSVSSHSDTSLSSNSSLQSSTPSASSDRSINYSRLKGWQLADRAGVGPASRSYTLQGAVRDLPSIQRKSPRLPLEGSNSWVKRIAQRIPSSLESGIDQSDQAQLFVQRCSLYRPDHLVMASSQKPAVTIYHPKLMSNNMAALLPNIVHTLQLLNRQLDGTTSCSRGVMVQAVLWMKTLGNLKSNLESLPHSIAKQNIKLAMEGIKRSLVVHIRAELQRWEKNRKVGHDIPMTEVVPFIKALTQLDLNRQKWMKGALKEAHQLRSRLLKSIEKNSRRTEWQIDVYRVLNGKQERIRASSTPMVSTGVINMQQMPQSSWRDEQWQQFQHDQGIRLSLLVPVESLDYTQDEQHFLENILPEHTHQNNKIGEYAASKPDSFFIALIHKMALRTVRGVDEQHVVFNDRIAPILVGARIDENPFAYLDRFTERVDDRLLNVARAMSQQKKSESQVQTRLESRQLKAEAINSEIQGYISGRRAVFNQLSELVFDSTPDNTKARLSSRHSFKQSARDMTRCLSEIQSATQQSQWNPMAFSKLMGVFTAMLSHWTQLLENDRQYVIQNTASLGGQNGGPVQKLGFDLRLEIMQVITRIKVLLDQKANIDPVFKQRFDAHAVQKQIKAFQDNPLLSRNDSKV